MPVSICLVFIYCYYLLLLQTPASPGVPNIYTIRRVSSLDQVINESCLKILQKVCILGVGPKLLKASIFINWFECGKIRTSCLKFGFNMRSYGIGLGQFWVRELSTSSESLYCWLTENGFDSCIVYYRWSRQTDPREVQLFESCRIIQKLKTTHFF